MGGRTRGFTIIEILVAIFITTVLASVGVASYVSFNRRQIVVQATKKVFSDLRLAQSMATNQEKPAGCTSLRGFTFNVTGGTSYWIGAECVPAFSTHIRDVSLTGVTMTGFAKVRFNILGGKVEFFDGKTQLTVSDPAGYSKAITVGEAGEIIVN